MQFPVLIFFTDVLHQTFPWVAETFFKHGVCPAAYYSTAEAAWLTLSSVIAGTFLLPLLLPLRPSEMATLGESLPESLITLQSVPRSGTTGLESTSAWKAAGSLCQRAC